MKKTCHFTSICCPSLMTNRTANLQMPAASWLYLNVTTCLPPAGKRPCFGCTLNIELSGREFCKKNVKERIRKHVKRVNSQIEVYKHNKIVNV